MEFYVYVNGAKRGPLNEEQVRASLAAGVLQPSDLASEQADGGWQTLASIARFTSPSLSPEVTPPNPLPPPPLIETLPAKPPADLPRLAPESLGPYARATLAPNETPCFKTSLHWILFVRFAFLALLAFVFLALPFAIAVQALTGSQLGWFALPLPAFIMIPPTLAFVSSELVVTDRRVLIKTGIIRRQTLEVFIAKVESISINQGFLGRMLDYGTVIIRGTGGMEEPFETIAHPLRLRNWVQQLQQGDVTGSSAPVT